MILNQLCIITVLWYMQMASCIFSPGNMKKNKTKLVENQQTCLLSF